MTHTSILPVAILGAGPVGLAAAAHLAERGQAFVVFERGVQVAQNVHEWAHVRMFSPWQYVVDGAAVRLLEATGWQHPPADALPTGGELVREYLEPLAALPALAPHLRLGTTITHVARQHADKMKDTQRDSAPFVVRYTTADGREGQVLARAIIDSTGTWHTPNPLGADGLPALDEARFADRIAYGIPDVRGAQRADYAGRRVMVVGSGHSAVNAVLDLAALKADAPETQIIWAVRGMSLARAYGGGENDELSARASLGTRVRGVVESGAVALVGGFRISALREDSEGVVVVGTDERGDERALTVDRVVCATGARPDLTMLRELRIDLDRSTESVRMLGPLIDPNLHSCGTVPPHGEAELRQPEAGFYLVGMKSYGRAPTFLLLTGYEQVRSVVAGLAGDWEAARQVELTLPETGVCSTDLDGGGCCGVVTGAAASVNLLAFGDISVKRG